jgi:hypothetical protein
MPEKSMIDDMLRQNWSTLHNLSMAPIRRSTEEGRPADPSCRQANDLEILNRTAAGVLRQPCPFVDCQLRDFQNLICTRNRSAASRRRAILTTLGARVLIK